MKNKILLYIFTVVIFSVASFLLGWILHQPAPIPTPTEMIKETESTTARLTTGGYELKIITGTSMTNRSFIFLDNKTGTIITTFSISNGWLEPPEYRIVRGKKHDWLVLRMIDISGTGLMEHYDAWYILSPSNAPWDMKMVLSYQSDGFKVAHDGSDNKYWWTDISNENYPDDSAVDIKQTTKICSTTEYGDDKDCSESSLTKHFMWDENKEEFILKK